MLCVYLFYLTTFSPSHAPVSSFIQIRFSLLCCVVCGGFSNKSPRLEMLLSTKAKRRYYCWSFSGVEEKVVSGDYIRLPAQGLTPQIILVVESRWKVSLRGNNVLLFPLSVCLRIDRLKASPILRTEVGHSQWLERALSKLTERDHMKP